MHSPLHSAVLNPMMALKDRKSFVRALRNAKRIASGKRVAAACRACRKSRVRCDDNRPCGRCVTQGLVETCKDDALKVTAISQSKKEPIISLKMVKEEASTYAGSKVKSQTNEQDFTRLPSFSFQSPPMLCSTLIEKPFVEFQMPSIVGYHPFLTKIEPGDKELNHIPRNERQVDLIPNFRFHTPQIMQSQAVDQAILNDFHQKTQNHEHSLLRLLQGEQCGQNCGPIPALTASPHFASALWPGSHPWLLPPLSEFGLFHSARHQGDKIGLTKP